MECEVIIGTAGQVTVRLVGNMCFISAAVISSEKKTVLSGIWTFYINILKSKNFQMRSILLFLITELTNIHTYKRTNQSI